MSFERRVRIAQRIMIHASAPLPAIDASFPAASLAAALANIHIRTLPIDLEESAKALIV
jgi:hypothetical protein